MTIHENAQDRENQQLAAHQLQMHLQELGMVGMDLLETPEHRRECYDFQIFVQGMFIGVVEIKTRKYASKDAEEWGSLLVETDQLTSLRKMFCIKSAVTGRPMWTKSVVIVQQFRKDNVLYAINIETLARNWTSYEDAGDIITDDHGKKPSNRTGKLVPLSDWRRVE